MTEEILKLAKTDPETMEQVLDYYKPKVSAISRQYFLLGGSVDDLIQEGMIGLYLAVMDYDATKNDNFSTFASMCIHRKIQSAVKKAKSKKNMPLNDYYSIDVQDGDDDSHAKIIVLAHNANPEKISITKQNDEMLTNEIKSLLSSTQYSILIMYLSGYMYSEIAEKIGKNIKFVDNSIQSIKRKLRTLSAFSTKGD